jgi:hypothetical protein
MDHAQKIGVLCEVLLLLGNGTRNLSLIEKTVAERYPDFAWGVYPGQLLQEARDCLRQEKKPKNESEKKTVAKKAFDKASMRKSDLLIQALEALGDSAKSKDLQTWVDDHYSEVPWSTNIHQEVAGAKDRKAKLAGAAPATKGRKPVAAKGMDFPPPATAAASGTTSDLQAALTLLLSDDRGHAALQKARVIIESAKSPEDAKKIADLLG